MLEWFYTDACADVGLGKWLAGGHCLPFSPEVFARLASRRLPLEVQKKTRTFARPLIRHKLRSLLNGKDATSSYREHLRWERDLGRAMVKAGLGAATHVFSMSGEGGLLLATAKKSGLKIVSEVYIMLSTEQILAEERREFPNWEPSVPDFGAIRRDCPFFGELFREVLLTCTDFFVCPSKVVQEDLVTNWGIPRSVTTVVPYGMNPRWLAVEPQPVRGRVLFVGSAEVRKGIHYLAAAATSLKKRGLGCDFRIAGNVTPEIRRHPECNALTYLGRIPRFRIHEEFQRADIFVLPSLAEGSAEVTYEAIAAGLPVITTKSAGSVIRDRIDGRIVPERAAGELADAIEELVEDRMLRNQMAAAARERAKDYTWSRYGERLIEALHSIKQASN